MPAFVLVSIKIWCIYALKLLSWNVIALLGATGLGMLIWSRTLCYPEHVHGVYRTSQMFRACNSLNASINIRTLFVRVSVLHHMAMHSCFTLLCEVLSVLYSHLTNTTVSTSHYAVLVLHGSQRL